VSNSQERKRGWRDFLGEARERVAASRAQWDASGLIRCEDPPQGGGDPGAGGDKGGAGGAGATGGDLGKPKIDPNVPEFRAAVAKTVQEQVAAARKTWEEEEAKGLKDKNAELLGKLKEQKEQIEALRHEHEAGKIGAKPEEFTAAVEEAAQRKNEAFRREQAEVMSAKDTKIKDLETEISKLNRQVHRSFIASEIARASIPPEHRMIHDGAEQQLIDRLEEAIVPVKIDGLPHPVARVKVNGVFQPTLGASATPDGLMAMPELLDLMRAGKGPINDAAWYFRSTGRGSGTVQPGGGNGAGILDWSKATTDQKAAYVREHGSAAARELIDKAAASAAAGR
jgi:hypothetical protein